ncbi:uncharacterized protein LOC124158684 isoform X3 [Ischnura elegans]|uniref:uncharacterized protein LOC124158684 isoform X3 n=1 Tax=Ischnura elegans TaxID=197161 RepID=UPI001ED8992A|nr:uncharacterized protein LOC124158684 isoform X3 [Ischnura elegans]
MEVVQGGGPLVCGPRATPSSTHPPLRLGHHHHHHRLEADGPASAALHVQTEEGGGGLDPSWWRISASGSWDGGERKMRYGKLIDDRPTGSIPGAVQRRKLELLETHAPGASMRVVHSQSHASWRQDGGDLSSGGLSSSTASRSLVSTSSSTRVTSYRQWSSNFSQTTSNVAASKQETTLPAVTEFGNLELALNPLDVSFLRTRGNVGRSGSIGSRRPPTRSRRLSSGAPSPDSQADSNPTSPEAKSPQSDIASDNNSSSPGDSPDDRRDNERRKSLDDSATSPVSESIRESVSRLMALGWHPPGAAMPPLPPLSPLRTNFSASTPLHRKRSVSSEELRSPDGGEGSDPEGDGLKWERGASVRRSLPSSEWRSAVGPAVDGGASRLLRLRDPLKSSSVPALGGPAATNRKGSLVTAESLREMKGRLKHRGSVELVPQDEGMTQSMSNGTESARKVELNSKEGPKVSLRAAKEDSIVRDDRRKSWSVGYRNVEKREVVNGDDNSGFASRRRSYVVEPTRKEELRSEEGPKVSLRAAKEDSVVQDDRRKSWSMGCRNVEKREVVNGEEDSGFANRRRSYAFEFSDDSKQSPSSPVKKDTDWLQLQNGEREEVGHRIMLKAITSDTSDFVQNRVNEMLKKWSALTGGSYEGDLNYRRASSSSPIMRRQEGRWSPAKNSSTTWLDHGDGSRSENGGDVERNGFSRPATTISGARTTLRLTHAKGHSSFEKETVSGTSRPLEKVLAIMDELPPSSSGHLVEDYSFPRGLSPVDWSDGDTSGILSIKEPLNKPELTTPATSAGISVTFSNSDGGDSHSSTSTRHHSVTHLESKEVDGTRTEGGLKVRTSKKVEFSKTEVHFAAESGRFHIVETAGKPPPSNNFRRRRRSPTGTLNVDSSAAGARAMLLGGPSALTNGMRFGDSPYEKRLLAGTDGAADSMPTSENEREFGVEVLEEKQLTTNGDNHYEYGFTSSRTFEDLETKEEETKSSLEKMQDVDMTSSTVNFRHMISEDTTEKPRGILRVNPATSSNPSSWKPLLKMDDESDDSSKPKFGGVRLRPVVSPELHSRINLSSLESSDSSRILSTEKSQSSPLSPGQMELQKLLKSLRPVSVTPYADNFQESNDELGTQVANGGGMEVRITSASQTAVANSVIIGGDTSTEVLTPLSVAQRVREVEERRQRELREKLTANQKARTPGQFSTRVTLGPGSSSVVSVEPQVLSNKSIPPTLNSSPPSPKLTAKISAQSKISRIQTSPDKVGPLQIVRKGIHEETCRMRQSSEILASPQEKAVPKSEADSAPPPTFGCRFDPGWRAPLSPLHLEIAPLQPLVTRRLSSSSTSSRVDDMWFKGLLTTAQPTHHHPPPSASWPSARGFGRVGDDRVVLKSPSLILQTMLSTAFPPKESKETVRNETSMSHSRHEVVRTMAVDAFRVKEVHVEKKVEKVSKETLMTEDKLQRNLSILRALYRDASEEECSDAYEAAGRLLGGRRMGGESRLGDGGSVVSGSWRRLKRAKAKQQQSSQRQAVESVPVQSPKPVPRKQSSKTKVKSNEPPRPPPRNHRSNAQARMKRTDAKGRAGTAWERADERTRRRGGGGLGGGGGDCGGKGIFTRAVTNILKVIASPWVQRMRPYYTY